MTKAEAVIREAENHLGCPYVYGTWGQLCTVSLRKRYANYNPEQRAITYQRCQRLRPSKPVDTCDGCPYDGKLAFDCRGFTHYCLLHGADIDITGGYVGRQWSDKNWDEKGDIGAMPDLVCCVFVRKANGNWSHTGLHIGGGKVIHCSGEVKYDTISGGSCNWTHYAIPKDLYTAEEIKKAHGGNTFMRIMKNGMRGEDVRELQRMLNELGYDCGKADGCFGPHTLAAVEAFQQANGLAADGICGPKTWEKLQPYIEDRHEEPDDPADDDDPEMITISLAELLEVRNTIQQVLSRVDTLLTDGGMLP